MGRLLAASVVGPSGRGSAPPSWGQQPVNNYKDTTSNLFLPLRVYFYESSNDPTSAYTFWIRKGAVVPETFPRFYGMVVRPVKAK